MIDINWRIKNLPENRRWEANGRWKGGIHKRKDGYIFVRIKDNKGLKTKYRLQHRVVMEEKIGRKLLRSEIVHHIDANPSNNNPDNLVIMTQSEHARQDYLLRMKNEKGQLI